MVPDVLSSPVSAVAIGQIVSNAATRKTIDSHAHSTKDTLRVCRRDRVRINGEKIASARSLHN